MYITFEEYAFKFDVIDGNEFDRLAYEAKRFIDRMTTGADGVKKLQIAFPTCEEDAMAVKYCAAKIITFLHQINETEIAMSETKGYETTEHGVRGKIISSVSAGNESITYATNVSASTAIDAAVKDKTVRDALISDMIREFLSGVSDANGVNLLYMGRYPRRYLC